MTVFVSEPNRILATMRQLIGEDESVSIAIAFWGRGACEELALTAAAPGTRILLNADSGACNPSELRKLLSMHNLEVRNAPRLHAKIVLARTAMLVGSANASANGLGFQTTNGWSEACAKISDAGAVEAARGWFELQWAAADEALSEGVIERAERAAVRLQAHAGAVARASAGPKTIASLAELRTLRIFVVITDEDSVFTATHREQMAQTLKLKESTEVDYYQDWPDIPKNALLVCFVADEDSTTVEFDEYWLSIGDRSIEVPGVGDGYPVVRASKKAREAYGLAPPISWKPSVTAIVRLFRRDETLGEQMAAESYKSMQYLRATDWCLGLYDFLMLCARHDQPVPTPCKEEAALALSELQGT